ncbi:hypothetical protein CEXT_567122 [Caerostris extrusa]|uniref:Aspartyl/asparaginy/proline hydroxylase domain-containing protein n=1 Tax=Caerostris extrusa TaxID=172846 RepID=A0AAV4VQZ4_CAEEX|nr:hypothetical protein CEXT_567122 [Caerostris extrusa]
MSDKEPRRRKKRKDSHSQRKDDIHTDEQFFTSSKSEVKDSDQELEEEVIVPTHQPSIFAKFVFVLLFSGLVVSMSFIFISLHGTDRGEVDIFDDHHTEDIEILHDDHELNNHEPNLHDEPDHEENGFHDESDHEENEFHDEPVLHDSHNEEESSETSFQENFANLFPGFGSILSFNGDSSKVSENESISEELDEADSSSEQISETTMPSSTADYANTEDQDSEEDNIENLDQVVEEPEIYTETTEEPKNQSRLRRNLSFSPLQNLEEQELADSQSTVEDLDFTTYTPEAVESFDQNTANINDFIETTTENIEEEVFSYYDKESITNEEDFKIREQLDDLEEILKKEFGDNDNYETDEDDDDDSEDDDDDEKCEELLQLHKGSPRLHYMKAQALDKLAETQRSNKLLEDAIAEYQRMMSLKDVPSELYALAGKRAADRMRFRGFLGKSVKLLSEMTEKYPQNVEIKNLFAVSYLMIGQNKEAKKVLYDVLKVKPDSGFAKVHLGFILKTDDSKYEEAARLLSEGIATREEGVIDGRFYFHLGDALHRTGKQDEAMDVYKEAVKEGLFLSEYQRSLYNVNGLTGKPWWDPMNTVYAPYFKILEKKWMAIRDEALSLTNEKHSGFLPETEGLQDTGDWKQFELFARGRKIEKNCVKAPITCSLLSQFPDAVNCKRGQVKFSIMQPSTHVWAHTGPTNCRLRSHLGLVIPEGTSIRVAKELRTWEEGKVILFDDSFEHEVWHNGTAPRLVLIVDFWHPELTAYQKKNLTPI